MRRRLLLFTAVLSLLSTGGCFRAPTAAQVEGKEQVGGVAPEPPDAADLREQIARVEKVLPQLSDRGAALYLLSTLKQRQGETREAVKLLRECLALHEGFDPAGSPSLSALRGSKEFDDLVRGVHREFPAVQRARLAFVTKEKDLVPEGLASDVRQNVLYLSSLNRRKIVKLSTSGVVSDFVPAGRYNLLPVLGIRLDPSDGTVWAASWSEDASKAELLHFDASGKLLGRYAPTDAVPHGFNDLVIRKKGEILLTDSVSNQVYRFDPRGKAFAPVPMYRELSAPNGIALADDDSQLFIADDFGVVRVDLAQGASADLGRGPNNTLAGLDGLYWHNGSLIAIQNGIGSPRVAAFRLSTDGTRVERTTILETRTRFTVTPTTGAIHGNDFYFMSNSQGDNLNGSNC